MSYSNQEFITEKLQESVFNELLRRPENLQCADCTNKSPTWASVDFGVFLCIRCSGIHRQLGPHITRVKSSKLDKWKRDQAEIMAYVGNKLANDFYEFKLPRGFHKLDSSSTAEECTRFVRDKYIKKLFAPPNYPDPVSEFLSNKEKGMPVDLSFANKGPSYGPPQQNNTSKETPVLRKKSLSLEDTPNEPTKKENPNQKPQQPVSQSQAKPVVDLLSDDNILNDKTQNNVKQPNNQTNTVNNPQNVPQANQTKTSSPFDFDFASLENKAQNQQQQQQGQGQGQIQNQAQFQNFQQQAQPETKQAQPDLKKLYQQATVHSNPYAMNPMMMNNGFNPYAQMPQMQAGFYPNNVMPQTGQVWNQAQVPQWNGAAMNTGGFGAVPMNTNVPTMYPNGFVPGNGAAFIPNNGFVQQQPQQFNYQMQANGFPQQGMGFVQPTTQKFF